MSTEPHRISIGDLVVEVARKNIKNLHLRVYPPNGRIRVTVPLVVSDDAVRLVVSDKLGWIKRQQAKFTAQPRQSQREMVDGESHYFLGQRYRLRILAYTGSPRIRCDGADFLDLFVRSETTVEQRRRVLEDWYRERLRERIPPLLEQWQPVLGVRVADWGIKRMQTRWGTCNIGARRIWLNLELIKKPVRCLEYVIVHELTHLLERNHNDRFKALMDGYLPHWRLIREELNRAPLGHEP